MARCGEVTNFDPKELIQSKSIKVMSAIFSCPGGRASWDLPVATTLDPNAWRRAAGIMYCD
jgi:hypothetical protein